MIKNKKLRIKWVQINWGIPSYLSMQLLISPRLKLTMQNDSEHLD